MVRDLLDANRIRAGKKLALNFEELDVCEIISETINELVSIHGPRFQLNIPSKVIGFWSKDSIRRILENLCQNAIKYGDQSTPITVTLKTESKGVELTIHNLGNPIAPKELEVLFNPHERARASQDSEKRGWGLGLTLVKGLTESMGGSVSVTSNAVHGTNFIVFLPYRSGPDIHNT
ncbi:MAG: HAMP domain-containing histidine kinase [Bacteriovoracaceae bacterium]|nr:HAMP domain-containing histidine kinase [Bacteriovoracaceae bacterium]